MTKQYSTVARIFIDKNIHSTFSSSYATVGVAINNVETKSLNTPNPNFASEWDIPSSKKAAELVSLQFSILKERLTHNYLNESYCEHEYVINKLTAPNFDDCDKFVKSVNRIKNAIKRKNPDVDAYRGCITGYIEIFLKAAKVDVIWFEHYSESINKPRFTTYSLDDIDRIAVDAALLIK